MKTSRSLIEPSTVIDRELPSNLVADDMELFESGRSYSTRDTYLTSLSDVWVSSESVVYRRGRLLGDTLADERQRFYYQTRYLAKLLMHSQRVRVDPSADCLLVTDEWSVGHFHWLTETLPRLWLVRDRLKHFVLLLPESPYVRETGIESLELLGLAPAEIIFMKPGQFLEVGNFHYVSRVANEGQMHDRIMSEIRQALVGHGVEAQDRIYFSRARAGFRKVVNEDELVGKLKQYGFRVVYGQSDNLRKQIELFSNCSTLLGLHGAGLANCLFMPPGGKVVELRKREPNYAYWHLADSVGHEYYYHHGVPDSERSLIGRGCNLEILIEDFTEQVLERL